MSKLIPRILEDEEIPVAWYTLFSIIAISPKLDKGIEAVAETVFIVLIGLIINVIGAFLFTRENAKIVNIGLVLIILSFAIISTEVLFRR